MNTNSSPLAARAASTRFWLLVVYPVGAVLAGVLMFLFLRWRFPQEQHIGWYSVGVAVVSAVSWYLQTWLTWLSRRKRGTPAS